MKTEKHLLPQSWQKLQSPIRNLAAIMLCCALVACGADETETACQRNHSPQFVHIPAGEFTKSANAEYPEEGRAQLVSVSAFEMMTHEVTNAQFAEFVRATNYVTDAEKNVQNPAAGSAVFASLDSQTEGRWSLVKGATWRSPNGPGSSNEAVPHHPVVHISYHDAAAYAKWSDARLPSEIEWEYAAHLGLRDPTDSRSGAFDNDGLPIANTWQGVFPILDAGTDGYRGAAPVGCFAPNKLGLFDMIGNVWEWTNTPYAGGPIGNYTIKGGSFLCANNFCKRYRPTARQPQEADFSTNHIGFRLARD